MIPSTWTVLAPREWMRDAGHATAYLRQRSSGVCRWVICREGETIDHGESHSFDRALAAADRALAAAGFESAPQSGWTINGPVSARVYRAGLPRVRASVRRIDGGIYRYEVRSAGSVIDSGYKAHVGKARKIADSLGHRLAAEAQIGVAA